MISLKKRNLNNKGFTIVELLIVIVVIGILALLVITTYSGIQAKARNSKRASDVKSLQTQIEAYFSQNGFYPNALIDPSNPTQSKTLVAAPVAKSYSYAVTQSDGSTSCESDDTGCAKYTLTATYEGTLNGSGTAVAQNLD